MNAHKVRTGTASARVLAGHMEIIPVVHGKRVNRIYVYTYYASTTAASRFAGLTFEIEIKNDDNAEKTTFACVCLCVYLWTDAI